MFVKLAFSVAANLDAEIMIMDEVLAVGDMKFQRKCISKMQELAFTESRTILYVSHNMSTIRELCNRCIVLDHGKLVFDGDTEEAIKIYLGSDTDDFCAHNYTDGKFKEQAERNDIDLITVKYTGKINNTFYDNEKVPLELYWQNKQDVENLCLRIEVMDYRHYPVTAYIIENFYSGKKGEYHTAKLNIDISQFVKGLYFTRYVFYNKKTETSPFETLEVAAGLIFRKQPTERNELQWKKSWGSVILNDVELQDE